MRPYACALSAILVAACSSAHGTLDGGTGSHDEGLVDRSCGTTTCSWLEHCCEAACGICSVGGSCPGVLCIDGGSFEACGGLADVHCSSDNDYCDYPDGTFCGGDDSQGVCRPRPTDCPAPGGATVCGCDGVDYLGDCAANLAGTDVSHAGSCTALPHDVAVTATCAPADGPAWRFVSVRSSPVACGETADNTLTIQLWSDLPSITPGTVFTVGSGTSSDGVATFCPTPTGPCEMLGGTVTFDAFVPDTTASYSFDLRQEGGPDVITGTAQSPTWCASERFCG